MVRCCILFCCVVGRGEQRTMLLGNTPHNTPKTCSQQPDIHRYTQIYTDVRLSRVFMPPAEESSNKVVGWPRFRFQTPLPCLSDVSALWS